MTAYKYSDIWPYRNN